MPALAFTTHPASALLQVLDRSDHRCAGRVILAKQVDVSIRTCCAEPDGKASQSTPETALPNGFAHSVRRPTQQAMPKAVLTMGRRDEVGTPTTPEEPRRPLSRTEDENALACAARPMRVNQLRSGEAMVPALATAFVERRKGRGWCCFSHVNRAAESTRA